MKPEQNFTEKPGLKSKSIKNSGSLIIAGPCAAESQEQVLRTAKALAARGHVNYFRAGIWKPRTSPGMFEGVGAKGLIWLAEVKMATGLPIATEVGTERHVYEALKHGIDMVWIGARTVSNPFSIQEIAEALRGVDIPIFVKNPLCPDLTLWEGAINRFVKVGLSSVGAIHRGFYNSEKVAFRNVPNWSICDELRNRMPQIPLLCDPSHISGKSDIVPLVAHRAMNLGFNGLMVEVHVNPNDALSDAAQQLTPNQFGQMMDSLTLAEVSANQLLTELRNEIDVFDNHLVSILAYRMKAARQVAKLKSEHLIDVFQEDRWLQILAEALQQAQIKGIDTELIKQIFTSIHKSSCQLQLDHMDKCMVK